MNFVVYHVQSTMERKQYKSRYHAERLATKLGQEYAVTDLDDYNKNVVKMVTRRNLQTGQEYQEPSNTPSYCSPSCEAYWSM